MSQKERLKLILYSNIDCFTQKLCLRLIWEFNQYLSQIFMTVSFCFNELAWDYSERVEKLHGMAT